MTTASLISTEIVVLLIALVIVLIMRKKGDGSKLRTAELFLVGFLVAGGVIELFGASGHYFSPEKVASSIGWVSNKPFQQEVGNANLVQAILLLGVLKFRGQWILAAIVASTVWILTDNVVHIISWHQTGDSNSGNIGFLFYAGFVTVIINISLYVWYRKLQKTSSESASALPIS